MQGLGRGLLLPNGAGPGFGVMAIAAAHGTALYKQDIPHAGAIDKAERFDRMDAAGDGGVLLHGMLPLLRLVLGLGCGGVGWPRPTGVYAFFNV